MKPVLPTLFTLAFMSVCVWANPFYWTGDGGDGNWSNLANWNPAPNFSADNATQNTYQFVFNEAVQMNQNLGGGVVRLSRMTFTTGAFNLEMGVNGQYTFGQATGGIYVTAGNHVISGDRFNFNIFTNTSAGGLFVDEGSLTLNATTGIGIAGTSSMRYLPVGGNGTIILNGALTSNDNGGTVRLREGFSGRLILNTSGSTITGNAEHRGTGILEIGANDALGGLVLRFENASARLESGQGNRVIQNSVVATTGFSLAGDHSMEFAGQTDWGTGNRTVTIENAGNQLILSGTVLGSSGVVTKEGLGEWVLSSDSESTWSQEVRIAEGTLWVRNSSGSATGSGEVYVENVARLGGNGRISGATSIEGTLLLGNEGGLTLGNTLSFETDSRIELMYGADAALVESGLAFADNVRVWLEASDFWQVGETYRLFELNSGEVTGLLALAGGYEGNFNYENGPGGFVEFTLTAIPEPGTWVLMIAVAILLGTKIHRRSCRTV